MLPYPAELLPTSAFTTPDTHIYQSGQDHKEGGSIAPNAIYSSPEHKHGVSSSADPYYSYVPTMSSNKSESSPTTNVVPNPVYGSANLPHNSDGIYTTPKPLTSTEKKDTSTSEEYPYSYARVETSGVSLKSSTNSVIMKDQHISQDSPPGYEYIKMAAAAPARPEVEENGPTVTLHPDSGSEEQLKVVFIRSIYDDNFQYETVNINKQNSAPAQVSESDSHQQNSTENSHYDIPRCTQSPEKPNELTPTSGSVPNQPPYDKLHHGTDFTQPMNFVRLGKIEGSGYEILNKSS